MHTFGIAYTNEPRGTEDVESDVDVVRNSVMFGPLSRSWRYTSVCGAFGKGKETSLGVCDMSPFVREVAIVLCESGVLVIHASLSSPRQSSSLHGRTPRELHILSRTWHSLSRSLEREKTENIFSLQLQMRK